jgi:predicted transcriptional regulator
MNNPVNDMGVYEQTIMKNYIELNDILFDFDSEVFDSIYNACYSAVVNNANQNPQAEKIISDNYIVMVSKALNDVRKEYSSITPIINDIVDYLNENYNMVFEKINMKQINNSATSYDICKNYYLCKVALDDLTAILDAKARRANV